MVTDPVMATFATAEFEIEPKSRLVGEKLRKAGFPTGSLVGGVVRGKDVLIPGGDDHFQAGDVVVVFALTSVAPKVHKLF